MRQMLDMRPLHRHHWSPQASFTGREPSSRDASYVSQTSPSLCPLLLAPVGTCISACTDRGCSCRELGCSCREYGESCERVGGSPCTLHPYPTTAVRRKRAARRTLQLSRGGARRRTGHGYGVRRYEDTPHDTQVRLWAWVSRHRVIWVIFGDLRLLCVSKNEEEEMALLHISQTSYGVKHLKAVSPSSTLSLVSTV